MVYQDGRQKQQNKMFGSGGAVAELQAVTHPTRPPVCQGPEAGIRGQEVEVKGHTRSVRILCFPEVFLWSWFLLQLWLRCCLFGQWWRRPPCWRLMCWAPPLRRQRFVPVAGCPSWPCSTPCGPAWSGTDVCRRNGPTLRTEVLPRTS